MVHFSGYLTIRWIFKPLIATQTESCTAADHVTQRTKTCQNNEADADPEAYYGGYGYGYPYHSYGYPYAHPLGYSYGGYAYGK